MELLKHYPLDYVFIIKNQIINIKERFC